MSNLLVWAVRGLLALCLQLCYPAARFQKEESVRRDPAYAVYETYRYAYERYGYLFSYAEETGGEGMVAAGNPSWQGEDGNAGAADREQESTGADGLKTEQTGAGSALSASSLARLQDYDYLIKQYFSVHASTTADRSLMKVEKLLGTDVRLTKNPDVPQILIYHTHASESSYVPPVIPEVGDSVELWQLFSEGLPTYLHEIATSLLPIVVMFGIFQLAALHIDRRTLGRIGVGLVYTYIGLVLFLTGANIGFMPAGNYLGQVLGGQSSRWLLIPIGMLIGYFIVRAEPAVYVLNKQVEEVTDGAISAGTMGAALSAGVALSVGLAMVRVLTGISILWFLIPGYLFAISISFVVPKLYTAIAFDAGGVASGPMTATFLLPLAQGACIAVGGNIVTDAFGVVAMVAMTPLITVQLMGLVAQLKTRKARSAQPLLDTAALLAELPDDAIIEL